MSPLPSTSDKTGGVKFDAIIPDFCWCVCVQDELHTTDVKTFLTFFILSTFFIFKNGKIISGLQILKYCIQQTFFCFLNVDEKEKSCKILLCSSMQFC